MAKRARGAPPSAGLSHDTLCLVFDNLDFQDVCKCAQVCRHWRVAAESNGVWDRACERMWEDKVHVNRDAVRLRKELKSKQAFQLALVDSRRTCLTREEVTSFEWYVRTKQGTLGKDPWWQDRPTMAFRFQEDGWARLVHDPTGAVPAGLVMSWGFVAVAFNQRRPLGHFFRCRTLIGNEERLFPSMVVQRFAQNWGFVIANCLGAFMSFPIPPRGECPELEDEELFDRLAPLQSLDLLALQEGWGDGDIPESQLPPPFPTTPPPPGPRAQEQVGEGEAEGGGGEGEGGQEREGEQRPVGAVPGPQQPNGNQPQPQPQGAVVQPQSQREHDSEEGEGEGEDGEAQQRLPPLQFDDQGLPFVDHP